jgi:hypothetical protein
MRILIQKEFDRGASLPIVAFPADGASVQDTPKLTLVVVEPESEWTGSGPLRLQISEWTKQRGKSPRLYPGSLVWCIRKPGRDFREKVEWWLAWKRVAKEIAEGTLGGDFDRSDRAELQAKVSDAEEAAKDEVWGGYRFVVLFAEACQPLPGFDASRLNDIQDDKLRQMLAYDRDREVLILKSQPKDEEKRRLFEILPECKATLEKLFVIADQGVFSDGLRTIDLGAGHSSGSETLCGRVVTALKSQALLNESVGPGYIERNWPPALRESGAWPLSSLRQSFLNGSLTRLIDPDTILRNKIVEFVSRGDFGFASGRKPDGGYERVVFNESTDQADVTFEPGCFLLLKAKARGIKSTQEPISNVSVETALAPEAVPPSGLSPQPETKPIPDRGTTTFRISGDIPPEVWNRFGTKILPKLRSGTELKIGIDFSVTIDRKFERSFEADLKQILEDLGLTGRVQFG